MIKAEWLWLADGGWVRNGNESEGPPKHINATANCVLTREFSFRLSQVLFFFHASVLCLYRHGGGDRSFFFFLLFFGGGGFGTACQMDVCHSESGMCFGAVHLALILGLGTTECERAVAMATKRAVLSALLAPPNH